MNCCMEKGHHILILKVLCVYLMSMIMIYPKINFEPAVECVFLGYPFNKKGWRFYNFQKGKFIYSKDVIFDETKFPYREKSDTPNYNPDFAQFYNFGEQILDSPERGSEFFQVQKDSSPGSPCAAAEMVSHLTIYCYRSKLVHTSNGCPQYFPSWRFTRRSLYATSTWFLPILPRLGLSSKQVLIWSLPSSEVLVLKTYCRPS